MNQFYETSKLSLTAAYKNGRTIIEDSFFTPPYKIAKPFAMENGAINIMAMSASAGILAGDEHDVEIVLKSGADVYYTSQSFEKVHTMPEGEHATRKVNITLESDSKLVYFPMPVIPFADSEIDNVYDIELESDTAKLMFVDIVACGRKARDEYFAFRKYRNNITIKQEKKVIFYDNSVFEPADAELTGFTMFEKYSHLGTIIMCNYGADINKIREKIVNGGASSINNIITVKVFGNSADEIIDMCDNIGTLLGI